MRMKLDKFAEKVVNCPTSVVSQPFPTVRNGICCQIIQCYESTYGIIWQFIEYWQHTNRFISISTSQIVRFVLCTHLNFRPPKISLFGLFFFNWNLVSSTFYIAYWPVTKCMMTNYMVTENKNQLMVYSRMLILSLGEIEFPFVVVYTTFDWFPFDLFCFWCNTVCRWCWAQNNAVWREFGVIKYV